MPYYSLSLAEITLLTNHLQEEILESPAIINQGVLNELGINTITGVEFKDTQFIALRKGGTTRPYVNGSSINSEIGKLIERELEVKTSWNRVVDNIQNYREKEPYHIDAESFEGLPNSTQQIKMISTEYAEDVFSPIWFGKYDATDPTASGATATGTPLDLYDGIFTKILNKINDEYTMTAGTGGAIDYSDTTKYTVKSGVTPEFVPATQIVTSGAFIDVTEATKTANWEAFLGFINGLPTKLRKAANGVYVYCSDATKARIMDSYCRTYPALTPETVGELGVGFMNLPKVKLLSHPVLGAGDMLLATTEGNFDFGIDSLNNMNKIQTGLMESDFNNVIFQIQSTQGTRVRYFDAAHLAWNGLENTADTTLTGDYQ